MRRCARWLARAVARRVCAGAVVLGASCVTVSAAAGAADAGITTVVMRASARADLRGPVRVEQVAEVAGPEAARLGAIEVVRGPSAGAGGRASVVVEPADVRRALDAAGINWARVSLRGVRCTVGEGAPAAAPTKPDEAARPSGPQPIDTGGPMTVRRLIGERLATLYGVAVDDLRLRFVEHAGAAGAEDRALLETALGAGRRVEAHPGATAQSGRTGVRVDVYAGDLLTATRTIGVEALIRRVGCVATGTVERGRVIDAALLQREERWLPPSAETPMNPEELAGHTARRRIDPGRMIVAADVRPTLVIRRGDEVVVHTLTAGGGMVLKSRARALGSAREGELVELRRDGSKRSFMARAGAAGVAVVVLGEQRSEDAAGAAASEDQR